MPSPPTDFNSMADQIVAAMRAYVKQATGTLRESVSGLISRADKHGQRLSAAEKRIDSLEKRLHDLMEHQ